MKILTKIFFSISLISLAITLYMLLTGDNGGTGPSTIFFFLFLALGINQTKKFRGFTFTILIFAAVAMSMYYPNYFIENNGFEFKTLIVPLLQIIMFGMGTAMSFKDFYGVIKMPKGVLIGLVCQFTIMPILGFSLASLFNFPLEIAAGIILIGSSPSGLASNVMAYLAKANIALSVTLTAVATLLAPIMTCLLYTSPSPRDS